MTALQSSATHPVELVAVKSDGDDRGVFPFFSQLSYSSFSPQEIMVRLKQEMSNIFKIFFNLSSKIKLSIGSLNNYTLVFYKKISENPNLFLIC